jgi:hypothetical protein
MGEQVPMDTIKDFVDAVWQKDDVITANGLPDPAEVWSKPDARTGSLELRRISSGNLGAGTPTLGRSTTRFVVEARGAIKAQSASLHHVARSTRVRLNAATLPPSPPTPSCHREC